MYVDRILEFGGKFQGRLETALLQGVLDYIKYNEEALAFEILCDHICEYDVLVSAEEYIEAVQLVLDLGFNLDDGPFKHLLALRR